jgi:mono/diheme cytochrome c family protein
MIRLGFLATVIIALALAIDIATEPNRQTSAAAAIRVAAVAEGTTLYAQNCVVCHGASGEGLGTVPSMNNDGLRNSDYETLFHTIERGRYNTAMAAYSANEGGVFANAQIDSLVALIQFGDWQTVSTQVAAMGLTPPQPKVIDLSQDLLNKVSTLPGGAAVTNGLTIYAKNCTACHGSNGEGTSLAPALNTAELRARLSDGEIARIILQGVPGTLMAGWNRSLTDEEVTDVTALIRRWDSLQNAGVTLPAVEAAPIDMSPAAIATGNKLYSLLCAQCHGTQGFGTRLAPALNSKTFLQQTLDSAIQQIISNGVQGTSMPAWGGRLNDADIAAITAYLRSLEPTAPAIASGTAKKPAASPTVP